MKRTNLFFLVLLLLASCSRQPAPQTPAPDAADAVRALGDVRVTFQVEGGAPVAELREGLETQATGLSFSPTPVSKGLVDQAGVRYLYAVFEGTNTSAEVLNNVDLFAVYVDTDNTRNLAGTAVADLRDALGVRLDDPGFARSIRPTHRMQDESGTLSVKQDEADFQGVDQRFDTVMHMQYTAAGNRTKVPGAWLSNCPTAFTRSRSASATRRAVPTVTTA